MGSPIRADLRRVRIKPHGECDDYPLYLVGALSYAQERRIPIKPFNFIFRGITVTTKYTHAIEAILNRRLGGEIFGLPGLQVTALTQIIFKRRLLNQQPCGSCARRV